jgi:urease accessory protein
MNTPAHPFPPPAGPARRQRARGEIRAEFTRAGSRTKLARLYQAGGLRLATPRAAVCAEGVMINTGGGMAGGDEAQFDFALGAGAHVVLTTQSAEKIYRGDDGAAFVRASIRLAPSARLEWLPQETILFEGARLSRRLEIDMAAGASLLLVEAFTFGRTAFGEDRIDASVRDSWRVRRGGSLVFADEMRLEGTAALLPRAAVASGARAIASILIADANPAASLEALRAAFSGLGDSGDAPEWGASQIEAIVIARALSPSPSRLRAAIVSVLHALRGRAAPRVWS